MLLYRTVHVLIEECSAIVSSPSDRNKQQTSSTKHRRPGLNSLIIVNSASLDLIANLTFTDLRSSIAFQLYRHFFNITSFEQEDCARPKKHSRLIVKEPVSRSILGHMSVLATSFSARYCLQSPRRLTSQIS